MDSGDSKGRMCKYGRNAMWITSTLFKDLVRPRV